VEYVPLIRRDIYWATEIRKRMLSGNNWEKLVPKSVADFINLQDGVQRIKDLMQSDKMIND
jgi:nicotinamide-nucleotide adenylyltransferase